MGVPDEIKRKVDTFHNKIESLKSSNYNETQVRIEFIDPFFTALGWDMENKAGYAEAYKDVIHEFSLKTKDVTEAPDYCFRIGGTKKFFVEAKKPNINIKDDIHPSFQLRRYAWTAKLPLSILTDFEEFAVYDCRIPPKKNDKPSVSRIMFLHYTDYIDKWEEIESIFSRDAVLKGSFDKYVESNKRKKGTAEVDAVFLEQMEEWRKSLAKNIALRNQSLSIHELNYSVQKTIDRIIFLRICEDRGIEDYGQLMTLQNGVNVYERLKQIFRRADEKYNSGLFHFEVERSRTEPPDELTLDLSIDDKSIKDIIKELYYPESPYEFSVLPADILGNVYEQFLGKVIRLTPSHHAVIEDKPEVKKAGGVYYTPTYIVDYIVKNTVGELLTPPSSSPLVKGRKQVGFSSPKEVSKLKILDPACGSGSFLLGAYQHLLDWHLKYYLAELETNDKLLKQKQPPIYMNERREYLLTTSEKKRILLNNIYGVDIDSQAVEVTKLSLMLKVLEGENTQTLSNALQFFRERALPDLSNNIKCGNSLIGPDFYDQLDFQFLSDEEKMRINVFDWQKEFKEIMNNGGFDVVIGNPPYGSWFGESEKKYLASGFESFQKVNDIFVVFLEKSFYLAKQKGLTAFIIPSAWTGGPKYLRLREIILEKNIMNLVLLPYDVFKDAYIDTLIIVSQNSPTENSHKSEVYKYNIKEKIKTISLSSNDYQYIDQCFWQKSDDKKIVLDLKSLNLITNIRRNCKSNFGDFLDIKRGVLFDKTLLTNTKENSSYHRYFEGDVYRFKINYRANHWIEFGEKMKERPKEFYWFEGKRILLRRLVNRKQRMMAQCVDKTFITNKNIYSIKTKDNEIDVKTILPLINSKLISYIYIKEISQATKDDFPQIAIKDFLSLPFPNKDKIGSGKNDIINLVDKITLLIERTNDVKTPHEKIVLERQIESIDNQIDQLVYQLYELTDEEIKIVEEN